MLHLSVPEACYEQDIARETCDERGRIITASTRDERDKGKLLVLADTVARTMDDIIPYLAPLEHPDARWRPDDLMQVLQDELANIRHELRRCCTGPIVLDSLDDSEA
jgi:hypothetical protein